MSLRNFFVMAPLAAGLIALSGCNFNSYVYRTDVHQGNLVTKEMIDQLQVGMARQQVLFLMGEPLIESQFHRNRWDYTYYLNPRYGDIQMRRVTLYFDEQDILTTVRMNYKIGDTSPTWQHVASISSEDGVYAHNLQLVGGSYQCSGDNPVTIAKEAVEACGGIYGIHFKEADFLWSTGEDESTEFCQATEKGYQVAFSVSFVQSSELPEQTGA